MDTKLSIICGVVTDEKHDFNGNPVETSTGFILVRRGITNNLTMEVRLGIFHWKRESNGDTASDGTLRTWLMS